MHNPRYPLLGTIRLITRRRLPQLHLIPSAIRHLTHTSEQRRAHYPHLYDRTTSTIADFFTVLTSPHW